MALDGQAERRYEMNDICLAISSVIAFIVFCGLEGGAFNCGQALMVLIPAMLLLLLSFINSPLYEPVEKGKRYAETKRPIR